MSHHTSQQPYIPAAPGDLLTAENWNELQQFVRADLADNAAADAKHVEELRTQIANVDAPKFGGKTPDDWNEENDKRYIRRDDPQAAGQFRRYFKQVDRKISEDNATFFEPAVIEHKLCVFPIVQVYELSPLFTDNPPQDTGDAFNPETVKFLVYYAAKRDPISQPVRTESSDWFFWGDKLTFWLDQFGLRPARTQKLDDLLNDFWGKMFDPGLEQDEFRRECFGHTPYVQKWIDDDKSVDDLIKGGQWDDLRVAVRPQLLSPGASISTLPKARATPANENTAADEAVEEVKVFHISQNAIEIRVPRAMDLMVLVRS